ncbi:MAG TPA: tRNA pseudouridine(55) synthase TruB [Solirubrobacterales bacterium]|jgi:tRNA pseudouridine55 synthase|nr:tRNA pseudouridine(55) synthase TruB [Solirubrobacterales bacterium]
MSSKDCGVLLVDKPAGVTSHDVVFAVRKRLQTKTGHAGTLDPFATGLLVVLLGRATRLQQYLLHQPKTYIATARLGWRSDTGDRDGELAETGRVPTDPELPTGALQLAVPAYSAIKVDGERLYAKARRGEEFAPPVREMVVYRAERMALDAETATFEIECAGGTYVRSIVATLEDAYCEGLIRTRVGDLRLEDADQDRIVEPNMALAHLPSLELDQDAARTLVHGRRLDAPDGEHRPADRFRLVTEERLIGVGRVDAGQLRPETMLVGNMSELKATLA